MTVVAECPVCGCGSTREKLRVETTAVYTAHRCRSCRLVFTWPRPTADELTSFYSASYFMGRDHARLGYGDYAHLGELNAERSWTELKRYAPLDQVDPRHVLDVGCATGGFLTGAKRDGWHCAGVEMSTDAAATARSRGLDVIDGDIFAVDRPGDFGLLTMWHVLEHLPEPAAALAMARDLLASSGLLFIELPNWNSVGRVVRRARWSQMKPPEHINYFTRRSLVGAVQRAGFVPLKSDTHYPSLWDGARLRRRSQLLHLGVALMGSAASMAGRGGYLRVLARR